MNSAEELRYLVLAAQREGNRILLDLLRPLGVSPSQAEVIRVLADHGPLSLVELGALLVCETGSPSRLVNGLVAATLLERIPALDDRRRVILSLTDAGRVKDVGIRGVEATLHGFIEQSLTVGEIESVNAILGKFVSGRPAGIAVVKRSAAPRPR
ncbi:MarR family transcriptional regulator [Cryobacterium suzukii]|uniref:MarR family transcriptional regulator n=1 Tax=Cryobacterium suzukii TaxID=1259198 RepID=A0A4R9ACK3_9MICO|nr:MarR family transcriptional regulator [Cryobacterium suzukii]TFD57250.1 MarR family transcriptional regulator [Cryobacterium suzukii]